MTLIEIIAFILGLAGVWLTIRENILCWPSALLSVIIYIYIFFNTRLYGDMALQIFYAFASIYGWYRWNKEKNKKSFTPTYMEISVSIRFFILNVILFVPVYMVLLKTDTDVPFADAILTSFSLSNTWLMARKKIENWLMWVVIDGAYVLLYLYKSLYLTALLYALFAIMAAYGYHQWKRKIN
jgi:nicotinamide mononucleotide transporter